LGFAAEALVVTKHTKAEGSGDIIRQRINHRILLGGVYGDSPGLKKVNRWMLHSATLGCGYCPIRAQRRSEGSGNYYGGYAAPVPVPGLLLNPPAPAAVEMLCGDYHLTHEDHVERAAMVDRGEVQPRQVGCHGTCCILTALPYVDMANLYVAPIAHAGLHGAGRDYWNMVLEDPGDEPPWYLAPSGLRKAMLERAKDVAGTCDFRRNYTDILSRRGGWTMEDWLHWTETWSVYIAQPCATHQLPPEMAEMWALLRSGLLYYMRASPGDGASTAAEATAYLKKYGALAQQHGLEAKLCKFNLHLLCCRMERQEAARGKVAYGTEYWVENEIQLAKSSVKYRSTTGPEKVLVHDLLLDRALSAASVREPRILTFDELMPSYRAGNAPRVQHLDEEDPVTGSLLLGRGAIPNEQDAVVATASVKELLRHWPQHSAGWEAADVIAKNMLLYTRARVRRGEVLHSTRYLRPTKKTSVNIMVQYHEDEGLCRYMAVVRFFLKASKEGACDIRVAVADLHPVELVSEGTGAGEMWKVQNMDRPKHKAYAVTFHEGTMLVKYAMGRKQGRKEAFFMLYAIVSSSS
jgi:hypothetical protein